MNPLQETIQTAAARIMEYLAENKTASSWKLKINIRLSSSVLYMALGVLYAEGKIKLEADELNYNVSLAQPQAQETAPGQQAA
ncbi:winged helix-turn-helix domain-containing protein [Candidatus Avelusimicrobium aviculae]|uniref:winged helix-turn-helix domain-containing protein n=1 Tax=Candidatus Avelusimicrobium aviculae TaxID=3416206 RepID=UPI003D104E5C